jgi:hypothetical protein
MNSSFLIATVAKLQHWLPQVLREFPVRTRTCVLRFLASLNLSQTIQSDAHSVQRQTLGRKRRLGIMCVIVVTVRDDRRGGAA